VDDLPNALVVDVVAIWKLFIVRRMFKSCCFLYVIFIYTDHAHFWIIHTMNQTWCLG